jgi:hypothetical protein
MVRPARFAGDWYSGSAETLRREVEGYIAAGGEAAPALGLVAPHAGYVYSGPIAGKGYATVEMTPTVIVLAPPHRQAGAAVSVWSGGAWQTPLGEIPIDEGLRDIVLERCGAAEFDDTAHIDEHSLELQLPFLQVRRADVKIVPVAVATRDAGTLASLGAACAAAAREAEGGSALIVASSDMNHFESEAVSKRKDGLALERARELDAEGMLAVVEREGVSMCGVAPAAAMLFAAKELGGSEAEVVAYGTSADVTGDTDRVVGYAAVVVRPASDVGGPGRQDCP